MRKKSAVSLKNHISDLLVIFHTDYFDLKALREWRGNESTVYFMPEAYHLDIGDKLLFMPKVFSRVCKE